MPFVGPITLVRRVIGRLNSVGWTRAAGSLAFTTVLGIVPLATVAFAVVAQFPLFQEFLQVLENYLLRYTLPENAAALVRKYVLGMATAGGQPDRIVDRVRRGHRRYWSWTPSNRRSTRSGAFAASGRSCGGSSSTLIGVTAGPVLVGAAITLIMWLFRHSGRHRDVAAEHRPSDLSSPCRFVFAAAGFTVVVRDRAGAQGRVAACGDQRLARRAFAFEATRRGFAWYVAHSPTYEILYGALAAFPLFLLWIFVFWMIVLAGAAVTRVARRCETSQQRDRTFIAGSVSSPFSCRIEARRLHCGRPLR